MGGSLTQGNQTTTTSSTGGSEPWGPSQSYLIENMGQANTLKNAGVGGQVFNKSTVVPFANQTMQAMNNTLGYANKYGGLMSKPLEAYSNQLSHLAPIAMGDFSNDATFNQTLGAAQDDARDAVNLSASAAGRYGSAKHHGNVANEIGELTNRAKLARQKWAQDGILSMGGAMSGAYAAGQAPMADYQNVGSMFEDLYTRQINDEIRLHNEKQMAPWRPLQMAQGIQTGAGSLGSNNFGTQSTTAPSNQPSTFGKLAGAGLQIAGNLF